MHATIVNTEIFRLNRRNKKELGVSYNDRVIKLVRE